MGLIITLLLLLRKLFELTHYLKEAGVGVVIRGEGNYPATSLGPELYAKLRDNEGVC